jgi:hypothetical protein
VRSVLSTTTRLMGDVLDWKVSLHLRSATRRHACAFPNHGLSVPHCEDHNCAACGLLSAVTESGVKGSEIALSLSRSYVQRFTVTSKRQQQHRFIVASVAAQRTNKTATRDSAVEEPSLKPGSANMCLGQAHQSASRAMPSHYPGVQAQVAPNWP